MFAARGPYNMSLAPVHQFSLQHLKWAVRMEGGEDSQRLVTLKGPLKKGVRESESEREKRDERERKQEKTCGLMMKVIDPT